VYFQTSVATVLHSKYELFHCNLVYTKIWKGDSTLKYFIRFSVEWKAISMDSSK
jgi:hypothetical protein